jgi:hypothetical protein
LLWWQWFLPARHKHQVDITVVTTIVIMTEIITHPNRIMARRHRPFIGMDARTKALLAELLAVS